MRRLGDKNGVARALINLGGNHYVRREIDKARALFAQSAELYRATGYRHGLATALRNLGLIATEAEEYDSALEAARESLALTREAGDRMGIVMSLKRLADISRARGEARNARDYYVEAAQLADEIHADGLLVTVLPAYARLLLQNDRTEAAVRLLGYLEEPVADNRELREMVSQDLAKARERLSPSEVEALVAEGRELNQRGALRLALTAW
jgi:tetratricopeptide (TPR) repeat protein